MTKTIEIIVKPVGSKNSAELEAVLGTTVAAARIPTSQLLEFTHSVSEAGRIIPTTEFPLHIMLQPYHILIAALIGWANVGPM